MSEQSKGMTVVAGIAIVAIIISIAGFASSTVVTGSSGGAGGTTINSTNITTITGTDGNSACPANEYAYNETGGAFFCSNVPYTSIVNFPAGCSAGQALYKINQTSGYCAAFVTAVSYLSTSCAANSVVYGITTQVISCTALPVVNYITSTCAAGSVVTAISSTTMNCAAQGGANYITSSCAAGSVVNYITSTTLGCTVQPAAANYITSSCAAGSVANAITSTTLTCTALPAASGATVSCAAGSFVTSIATSTATCAPEAADTGATASCSIGSFVTSIATSTGTCQQAYTLVTANKQSMDTTTLSSATSFSVSVSASTTYFIQGILTYTAASATVGINVGFGAPTGSTLNICEALSRGIISVVTTSTTKTAISITDGGCVTATATTVASHALGETTEQQVTFDGFLTTSTTAGVFGVMYDSTTATTGTITLISGEMILFPTTG